MEESEIDKRIARLKSEKGLKRLWFLFIIPAIIGGLVLIPVGIYMIKNHQGTPSDELVGFPKIASDYLIFYGLFLMGGFILLKVKVVVDEIRIEKLREKLREIHREQSDIERVRERKRDLAREEKLRIKRERDNMNKLPKLVDKFILKLSKENKASGDVLANSSDFKKLLLSNQKKIISKEKEYGENHLHQFVKLGLYLEMKSKNIVSLSNKIEILETIKEFEEISSIYRDERYTYNLLLFNALNMVSSLLDDDRFTFYSIYEKFDMLNVFSSNHEKEISQKLSAINDNMTSMQNDLIAEIRQMNSSIVDAISDVSYQNQQIAVSLDSHLSEIDSTLKVGNLINSINAYQSYKINKNTKKLN